MTTWHKAKGTWKNKITQYITLSNFSKNKFLHSSLKLKEDQLSVKGNFVFDKGFDFDKEDYFLFVGRLSREKGIDLLLEAFKKVSYKIDIVGDGPEKGKVLDAVKSNSNFIYSGYQDEKTIIAKMKKAKALVFPSVCYEGFPMVVLEAFSSGTPVIAAEMGSIKEIVKHKINGLHFKFNDVESLISQLDSIQGKEDFIKSLFRNCREEYERLYTPEKNYQELISIYHKAISIKEKS
jgi:glycosyltransferase involved in cell wall biosynthesis